MPSNPLSIANSKKEETIYDMSSGATYIRKETTSFGHKPDVTWTTDNHNAVPIEIQNYLDKLYKKIK